MEDHKNLGKAGEIFAAKWLMKNKAYKIIDRNVYAQGGEIDIVAYDKKEEFYILVEVKTRTSQGFVLGIESIGPQKIRRMQRVAVDFFHRKMKMSKLPEYEIHGMVLTPLKKTTWWGGTLSFEVEYYDDLG